MITIPNIGITITDTNAPYQYFFNSDSECITFDNPEGTTSSTSISTNAIATSSTCLGGANLTVTVINSKGCSVTVPLTLVDPCSVLTCGDTITARGNLTFHMWATSVLCDNVTFDWTVDNQYEVISQSDTGKSSIVQLKFKPGISSYPTTSDISVLITDCNGCEIEKILTFDVCRPIVYDTATEMFCTDIDNNGYEGSIQIPTPGGNCSASIDWDTLAVKIFNNDGVTDSVLNVSKRDNGLLLLDGTNLIDNPAEPYKLEYSVADSFGVRSATGTIIISIEECTVDKHIYGRDIFYELDPSVIAGTVLDIPIGDYLYVVDGYEIDASSFQETPTPRPLSPTTVIMKFLGGSDDPVLEYEVPSPVSQDVVGFTICDTEGFCSDTIYLYIVDGNSSPDAVVPLSDTTVPQTSVVLRPDLSADPASFTTTRLVSQPTKGTVQVLSTGQLKYTPNAGTEGTDTFDYEMDDTTGTTATSDTVTITIVYAGEDTTYNLCSGLTVTPYNLIDANSPSTPTISGTWTRKSATGPAAPGVYNGTLDFSSFAGSEAVYCYEYSVTSGGTTDTATINFVMDPYESVINETCAASTAVSLSLTQGSTGSITNIEMEQNCPGSVGATDSGVANPASWSISGSSVDMWYKVSLPLSADEYTFAITVSSVNYTDADALKYPKIALYSDCTPTIIDSTNATNERLATLYHSETTTPVSATTFYIRVGAESGEEGKFNITLETL